MVWRSRTLNHKMKKEKINMLDVIPCFAEHITINNEEGLSVIAFPRFKRKFLQQLFKRKGEVLYGYVKFEEHGTAVLALIDGKRTVREIVELLAGHFQHEENYDQRVTLFLAQLQSKGFIKLLI